MFCYLRNLSSVAVFSDVLPWDFKGEIPAGVREDKKARDAWINTPTTQHHVYTVFEGVSTQLRIRAPRNGEGNPVFAQWGLVADYDYPATREEVDKFIARMPYPPNWVERTLSGNWRFVWLFEERLLHPSQLACKHFQAEFDKIGFPVSTAMMGFDKGAWNAPERYYTNSCEWFKVHDKPLSKDLVQGWAIQAGLTYKWTQESSFEMPLDVVAEKLKELFPRFADWPGEFREGAQGPTFWVDGSVSPKSAVVRATGMSTFAAHAHKSFFSWEDLLGVAFCKEYKAKQLGAAVEGIYFDGKHFLTQLPSGGWDRREKGDLALHLRVARGVSSKYDKNGVSDVERATEHIRTHSRVLGAAPFLYRPTGLIRNHEGMWLNVCTAKVMTPADEWTPWGPDGKFVWLSRLLTAQHGEGSALATFQAWFARFYQSGLNQQPVNGQAVFIAGPTDAGKTLVNREVIGALAGGYFEVTRMLSGEETFGGEAFFRPLWVSDDGEISSNPRMHRRFSEIVKRMAANTSFECRKKFEQNTMADWRGRLVCTLNDDEESLRQLPDLGLSNRDKILLFRINRPSDPFPPASEIQTILRAELPYLARWLADHKPISTAAVSNRFGVAKHHDEAMLEAAFSNSPLGTFASLVDDYLKSYFENEGPDSQYWEGATLDLYKALQLNPTVQPAMRAYSVDSVGRLLASLANRNYYRMERLKRNAQRYWRIHRPISQA